MGCRNRMLESLLWSEAALRVGEGARDPNEENCHRPTPLQMGPSGIGQCGDTPRGAVYRCPKSSRQDAVRAQTWKQACNIHPSHPCLLMRRTPHQDETFKGMGRGGGGACTDAATFSVWLPINLACQSRLPGVLAGRPSVACGLLLIRYVTRFPKAPEPGFEEQSRVSDASQCCESLES